MERIMHMRMDKCKHFVLFIALFLSICGITFCTYQYWYISSAVFSAPWPPTFRLHHVASLDAGVSFYANNSAAALPSITSAGPSSAESC